MNKFCTKCGTKIPKGYKFCPNCGEKIENFNVGKKKILPLVIVVIVVILILVIGILIGRKNNKEKMVEALQNQGYNCINNLENEEYPKYEMVCEKEENDKKRIFKLNESIIDYEEIIYDSGAVKVRILINDSNYHKQSYGVIKAFFHGEDIMRFYPKHCNDEIDCYQLQVGEKVYPAVKEKYEKYQEYFATGKDREYLKALENGEYSLSEKLIQDLIYKENSKIKDDDEFTKNVNNSLRYYEETLEEAGVNLEE